MSTLTPPFDIGDYVKVRIDNQISLVLDVKFENAWKYRTRVITSKTGMPFEFDANENMWHYLKEHFWQKLSPLEVELWL